MTTALEFERFRIVKSFIADHGVLPSRDNVIAFLRHPDLIHLVAMAIKEMGLVLEDSSWKLAWRHNPTWCLRMVEEGRLPVESSYLRELIVRNNVDGVRILLEKGVILTDESSFSGHAFDAPPTRSH